MKDRQIDRQIYRKKDREIVDRLHLLPQHNYIFTYNTTKHFTSYSDVDAAKGKRIGQRFCTVLRLIFFFNNGLQCIESIICVGIYVEALMERSKKYYIFEEFCKKEIKWLVEEIEEDAQARSLTGFPIKDARLLKY